jgi:hypothetical protein
MEDRVDKTQAGLAFLEIEVQLGLTFLGIAQQSDENQAKADRNLANARKAYDALLRFVQVVEMTDAQSAQLQTGIDEIAVGLKAAGDPRRKSPSVTSSRATNSR